MAFTLRNATRHTGAEIEGIDLARPVSAADRAALDHALADRGMIVFHDQQLDAPGFAKSLQIFSELMRQQAARFCLPDHPLVGYISNRDTDEPGGRIIVRGEQFHTDHSNYPVPPKATILYGISIPNRHLYMTEGDSFSVLRAEMPVPGRLLHSHQ